MATLAYNSHYNDLYLGRVVVGTSTIKALITTSGYVPSKDNHATRANITNEVSGTGYTAGGFTVTATLAQDLATDKTTLTLGAIAATGTTVANMRQVVYYVSNGGAASGDYLLCVVDFGSDYSTSNQAINISTTTMSITNPN